MHGVTREKDYLTGLMVFHYLQQHIASLFSKIRPFSIRYVALVTTISLLASFVHVRAQQPTDTLAGERTKFIGKISHWLAAYGASGEDFMREKRNAFKSAAFAEVYIEGIIDHPAWMFTMLNRVTQAKYAEKQTPYILFGIKFTPQDDNLDSYEISLTLQEGSAIAPQRDDGIVSNASAKHLGGKTYAEPVAAEADLEKAIGEALDGLQAKLGNSLAPKLMVRYQDEVFWNGHEIPILDAEGNSVELEAIDKDGALLSPDEITWTNADPFQSRGVVDMTGTQTKAVTLSWGNDAITVTLNRVSVSQDINELLKALIIEALSAKKQEAMDSAAVLKQDSIDNAQAIAAAIRALEARNFPLEGGEAPVPLFSDGPRVMSSQDEAVFQNGNERVNGFELLRKRRDLRMRIREKVNVVALANLIVDQPERVDLLLDGLLRNSGRLIAQLLLGSNSDGVRDQARNIVVDYLNRNIETVAGGAFGFAQDTEPPLQVAIPTTPDAPEIWREDKLLYFNDQIAFEGKPEFILDIEAYLAGLDEPLYVFINYSQDVSTESYLQRANATRPKGIPEGVRFVTLTVINIPGSVKYQVVGSRLGLTLSATRSVDEVIIDYVKSEQTILELASQIPVGDFIFESNTQRVDVTSFVEERVGVNVGDDLLFQLVADFDLRLVALSDKTVNKTYFWEDASRWYKDNDGNDYDNWWALDVLNAGIGIVRPLVMVAGGDPHGVERLKTSYANFDGNLTEFIATLAADGVVELISDLNNEKGSYRKNQALLGIWLSVVPLGAPGTNLVSALSKQVAKYGIKVGGKTLQVITFTTLLNVEIFRYSFENSNFIFKNAFHRTASAGFQVIYKLENVRYLTDVDATVKQASIELVKDNAGNIGWRIVAGAARLFKNIDEFKAAIASGENVFYVGKHSDIIPRPTGVQSHHGVNSVWMKNKYSNYSLDNAPSVYMLNEPNHNATRGVFNTWRSELAKTQGVSISDIDYARLTKDEILKLAERQFDAADVPKTVRDEYYKLWNDYLNDLTSK